MSEYLGREMWKVIEARQGFKEETKGKGDAYTMGYRQRSESLWWWLLICKVRIWLKSLLQGGCHWQWIGRRAAAASHAYLGKCFQRLRMKVRSVTGR